MSELPAVELQLGQPSGGADYRAAFTREATGLDSAKADRRVLLGDHNPAIRATHTGRADDLADMGKSGSVGLRHIDMILRCRVAATMVCLRFPLFSEVGN
jgi:hypothetical protein